MGKGTILGVAFAFALMGRNVLAGPPEGYNACEIEQWKCQKIGDSKAFAIAASRDVGAMDEGRARDEMTEVAEELRQCRDDAYKLCLNGALQKGDDEKAAFYLGLRNENRGGPVPQN